MPAYENDLFENEHPNHAAHSQDDKDGVDEDVSSEGSCRTSLYQKSLRDDEEIDSNTRLSAQMHNKFSEKSSSMNQNQEDVKTDFTHT